MKQKIIALSLWFCCLFNCLWAQDPIISKQQTTGPWKDIQELSLPKTGKEEARLPDKFRLMEVDIEQLNEMLSKIPLNFSEIANKPKLVIELPLPDGSSERFVIYNDPIMHPDLATKYPEIQTFAGYGIDDPTATVRMDLSPHGFNAQILSSQRGAIYIAPIAVGDNRHHICYYKKDAKVTDDWLCLTEEYDFDRNEENADGLKSFAGDCQRRVYRLAVACTGEYTAFFSNPNPPAVAPALAAINTSVNAVNGIYQREFAIFLQPVANNNLIVFLDPATDMYTNGNVNMMATQNQGRIDGIIMNANYDIGHVLGTLGMGNSGVVLIGGTTCNAGGKAMGATVSATPQGAVFNVDFFAHEVGHQFSASHTFNEGTAGSCGNVGQLIPGSAFEPGSGSTIMGYAGICNPVNVQPNSDPYFHARSLQQVATFVISGGGSACGTIQALANNQPAAGAGADFTVPVSTPFRLTATGTDPDGDPLTFCWEQMDNQLIAHPPASTVTGGPVFRSFLPTSSPTRYFPSLPNILNNSNSSTWEVLPSVSRTMNFRVTGRDNFLVGGCTAEDGMVVTFDAIAGPFLVTGIGPDDDCFFADSTTTITWNVANTTAAPVSCANVDIWLSVDGGFNFPTLLASNVPNDGSQLVSIPANVKTTQGRIMVICSNNIFLDINGKNIAIDCPANITVTDNPASGTYQSRRRIETMGTVIIAPFTSARFFAGEEIKLKPGFWAQSGSDFLARIQPCDPCDGTKPETLAVDKENPKVYFYEIPSESRGETASLSKTFVYPNPFNQNFTVNFEMAAAGKVEIQLIDVTGRQVQQVYQNDNLEAGEHVVQKSDLHLTPGVYYLELKTPTARWVHKLVKISQ